jgi:hypothetical protein
MSVTSTFTDGGEPERIRLGRLTLTVFSVLEARAFIGRVFDAKDAARRQADTLILRTGSGCAASAGRPTSSAAPCGSTIWVPIVLALAAAVRGACPPDRAHRSGSRASARLTDPLPPEGGSQATEVCDS